MESSVDTIYLGGGTPTVLETTQLERLFVALRENFEVLPDAEVTVECAPGTLTGGVIESLQRCGVNRVSLGVQSFADEEARAVGRLHSRAIVMDDVSRLRAAGIVNINIDLIAGLPHQAQESWDFSLEQVVALDVPHASVYMLEVDEDSRLGREVMEGGTKYHAHFVPDDDVAADFYESACEKLEQNGTHQYEISNFAREGFESRHNLKYWTRQPYMGFGMDAHSMLIDANDTSKALRFSGPDSLEKYVSGAPQDVVGVDPSAALEEEFFLGLRLNRGVDLQSLRTRYGVGAIGAVLGIVDDLVRENLLELWEDVIRLTGRGRMVSNEVFEQFIGHTLLRRNDFTYK